jgi:O-antigen ligase
VPLLLPFGIALEVLILCLALVAGWQLWQARDRLAQIPGLRPLALSSALLAGAGLASAIGAVRPALALLWVLSAIGYGLFAAFWILICRDPVRRRAVLIGAGLAVALWTFDALLQALTGIGLGGRAEADRLSGVFGSGDLKLGPVLAMLAPFLLVPLLQRQREGDSPADAAGASATAARERGRRWLLLLAFLALTTTILLAGARAGWIGYSVGLVGLVCFRYRQQPARLAQMLLLAAVVTLLLGSAGYALSERFAERVERTLRLLDGSRDGIDHALAGRLPIFETAARMSAANPLNGVGVRGFRYAYPEHAGADDPWLAADGARGAAHPHYWPLEVLAEQGLIGALAWLLLLAGVLRLWLRADARARLAALAPALALLVLLFPFNTHPALYSSFWQALFWWVLGLYLACLTHKVAGPGAFGAARNR